MICDKKITEPSDVTLSTYCPPIVFYFKTAMKTRSAALAITSFLFHEIPTLSLSTSYHNCANTMKQKIIVQSAGCALVNGIYEEKPPTQIPAGFDRTCKSMSWNTEKLWKQLSDQQRPWYEAENESYIYWNKGDGKWWIDEPSGGGVYIVKNDDTLPPKNGWISLSTKYNPLPLVEVVE